MSAQHAARTVNASHEDSSRFGMKGSADGGPMCSRFVMAAITRPIAQPVNAQWCPASIVGHFDA
jgi:hypothetical protein